MKNPRPLLLHFAGLLCGRAGKQRNYSPSFRGRRLHCETCEERRVLATFYVANDGDGIVTGPGDQPGTLRQAIFDADNVAGVDEIRFSTNPADGLNGGTITLTQGELSISEAVTIDAAMLSLGLTIDAGDGTDGVFNTGDGFRIFNITDPTSGAAPPLVTLQGLTLTGGDSYFGGGAIFSRARLSLADCVTETDRTS